MRPFSLGRWLAFSVAVLLMLLGAQSEWSLVPVASPTLRATAESAGLGAVLESRLFTLHERHFITMAEGTAFELSNELFHLVRDVTNIEGLGWQLRGNILGLNFELYDENGQIIAVIAQKLFSLHDKYCIDIYRPEYEKFVVAILITLQHMIRDREAASSGASSSSSSNN